MYSPPLTSMNYYDRFADRLVPRENGWVSAPAASPRSAVWRRRDVTTSVEQLLADARRHIDRVRSRGTRTWRVAGALLIDIRPERQRAEEGEFDRAIVVERNVLEWRFDLGGDARPRLISTVTASRWSSRAPKGMPRVLAAASLRDLGFTRVADLAGGYVAWRAWRGKSSDSHVVAAALRTACPQRTRSGVGWHVPVRPEDEGAGAARLCQEARDSSTQEWSFTWMLAHTPWLSRFRAA